VTPYAPKGNKRALKGEEKMEEKKESLKAETDKADKSAEKEAKCGLGQKKLRLRGVVA